MSIIHDALKKVQTDTTNIPDTHTTKPCDKKDRPQQASLILAALTAIAGITAFLYYISPTIKASLPQKVYSNINKSRHRNTLKILSQTPITKKSSPPQFMGNSSSLFLNGTMIIDNKKAALINNEIYKIGDTIAGKKIINITLEGVELLDDNGIITLKQRR